MPRAGAKEFAAVETLLRAAQVGELLDALLKLFSAAATAAAG